MYAKIGGIGRNTGNGFEGKEIQVHHMDDLSNRDFCSEELIVVKAAPILFEMGGTSRALFYTMLAYASSRTNVLMRDLRPITIILKFESVINRRIAYSLSCLC